MSNPENPCDTCNLRGDIACKTASDMGECDAMDELEAKEARQKWLEDQDEVDSYE